MSKSEINELKALGCEFKDNPRFLADEGYFESLYEIYYKGHYIGTDLLTVEQVKKRISSLSEVY